MPRSPESDGEIAFLYAAVRRAVERSSIRDVARQSGMSHGGVHNIVTGTTNRTYGATICKLREWYLGQWARGGDGLTPEVATYLIEQVLAAIEPWRAAPPLWIWCARAGEHLRKPPGASAGVAECRP
jgi:hypothetical protein